ncbi:ATP-binding protein, partial [Methylocystis silviterrae]|uniref:ATP-binding protein n=1 Tax=Methylocystis silviterrae TaxID=2743612 RepID=UPI001AEE011F
MPTGNAVAIPTKDDFRARINTVVKTFTPGTPISSLAELVGREASLRELLNIVASPGEHAFIAGARGTGKTSLVSWTPPKTSGQIGVELIHLVMSQGDRGHGEGNARI